MRIYEHQWTGWKTYYINASFGFCKVLVYRDEMFEKVAEIYDLIVYPEERGKGCGNYLLTTAIEIAMDNAANAVVLWPDCEPWVLEWYERKGFYRSNIFPNSAGQPGWARRI